MKKQFGLLISLGLLIFSSSCKKEEDKPVDTGFLHGIYIVNEGGFTKNNGSVTYYDEIGAFVYPNLFYQVNARGPGDVIQSFSIAEDMGFIVANNSGRVEVVDMKTFASIGTVINVDYPRYVLGVTDKKVYLTSGNFGGFVQVINLENLEVDTKISVGSGPENLIMADNKVFVANSGGWGLDSTISVIDPTQDKVINTIEVGDNPTDLVEDENGDIWVLCKGKVIYDQSWNVISETDSRLVQIKIADLSVGKNFVIGNKGDFFAPLHLAVSKDGKSVLYAEVDGIYRMDITASSAPLQPIIIGSFYGLDVSPENGDIYALKANGFDVNGVAFIYQGDGRIMDSLLVGIAPNAAVFN
jgi:YVTN family beta-propeller protein